MRNLCGKYLITAAAMLLSLPCSFAQDLFPGVKTAAVKENMPAEGPVTAEEIVTEKKDLSADTLQSDLFPVRNNVRMGVLLPFSNDNDVSLKGNMDFYFGVLMAARQLGKEGVDIEIDARDYSVGSFHYISMRTEDDMVLGPVKYSNLCLAKASLCPSTVLVSPLDHKAAALADSCFVQGPAPSEAQWEEILKWEFEDGDRYGTNYIVVKSLLDTACFREVRQCLNRQGIRFSTCTCDVSHNITDWGKAYVEGMKTCVILALSNEATLNNAIRNMGILSRDKEDIRIYAGSKVTSYRTIPVENVHKINLRVVCQYYVDYKDQATLDFIHAYRALFHAEPSQYSFQGYDLAYFMGRSRWELGVDWRHKIMEQPQMKLLQSNILIRENSNGGLANFGMRRIQYTPEFEIINASK